MRGPTRSELATMVMGGPALVVKRTLAPARVTYVSPNIERLLGYTVEAAMQDGFFRNHAHPNDGPKFMAALQRIASGEASTANLDVRLRHGDGHYCWISLQVVPDEVRDGQVVSIITYALDVDARHKALEAQRDAHRIAVAANQAKSSFLSRVSHELRTPLNAILGFGQLLEDDVTSDDQKESVAYILNGGKQLLRLVDEVLDLASLRGGELRLTTESIDPGAIVRACVDLLTPSATAAGVTISVDDSAAQHQLRADEQRVTQVLRNLLSNAVKYNHPGGSVTVTVGPRVGDVVLVAVSDTGCGIPQSRLAQLFVPFERLGAERTNIEGVGLGLVLARQLAQAMGGDITVQSDAGRGSTFTLSLPVASDETPAVVSFGPPQLTRQLTRDVVHIEDNLTNLGLVERSLAKEGPFTVMPAVSGSIGLELARIHRPELVMLDLHLADMSAEAVLHNLRSHVSTAAIPVVVLSAGAIAEDRRIGLLAAGAEACLAGPIDVAELDSVLRDALMPRSAV